MPLAIDVLANNTKNQMESIVDIHVTGLKNISPESIKTVIPIKVGDPFDIIELDKSIGYLRKWGIFDSILAQPRHTGQGIVVDFHLREAVVIASIEIAGNYPFVENKIRKQLSLHAGDIYTQQRVDDQIERIKKFYSRQGFIDTHVYVSKNNVPEVNGMDLVFHIKRGNIIRYGNIEIAGNTIFPKGRFISAINPLKSYSRRRLQNAIKKIKAQYSKKGYPRARIKVTKRQVNIKTRRIDIALKVYEGHLVRVQYTGGKYIQRKFLKDNTLLFQDGIVDEFEVETSAKHLESVLRKKGYLQAFVTGTFVKGAPNIMEVTFHIREGQIKPIRFLSIEGLSDFSMSDFENFFHNRRHSFSHNGAFLNDKVHADNEFIRYIFRKKGYLNATLSPWEIYPTKQGFALDVVIPADMGYQSLISSITFSGEIGFDKTKLLSIINIDEGDPFNEPDFNQIKDQLLSFYADNGYPYADILAQWNSDVDHNIQLHFEIFAGKPAYISDVLFVGDVMTSQRAIRNAMAIKKGDLFSYQKIIDSQLNIRRLGAFSSVNLSTIGLEDERDQILVKIHVEEQRPFLLDLGVNYSTDNHVNGSLTFSNRNAFGWAKINTLQITAGQELSRVEIAWIDPSFFGSSFEMNTNAWVQYKQKPAYRFIQTGGALGWLRRLHRFAVLFRFELDRNYFISGDSVAADADSLRNNTISRISTSVSYDSRDSFSNPKKGFFVLGSADIFNEYQGNEANFAKISWEGEYNISPVSWFTISTATRFDRLQMIGSNVSVPSNELFFLGGDDTVRGFEEDVLGPKDANDHAVGGRTRWIINHEWRLHLSDSFQFAGFADIGALANSFSGLSWINSRKSAGVGLRIITPVGPIRADYGIKLNPADNEPRGRFHFTFGYVF